MFGCGSAALRVFASAREIFVPPFTTQDYKEVFDWFDLTRTAFYTPQSFL
jgi:hypothetical protein